MKLPSIPNYLYKQYFYDYGPEYYVWPVDVHVINYLLYVEPILEEKAMHSLATVYVESNPALSLFSYTFRKDFIELCVNSYAKYFGMQREKVINSLVVHGWKTWDLYSLSVMFMSLFFKIVGRELSESGIDNDNDNEKDVGSGGGGGGGGRAKEIYAVPNNRLLLRFIELLLMNIHPDMNKRLTYDETFQRYSEIFYTDESIQSHKMFISSLGNFDVLRKKK